MTLEQQHALYLAYQEHLAQGKAVFWPWLDSLSVDEQQLVFMWIGETLLPYKPFFDALTKAVQLFERINEWERTPPGKLPV